MSQVFELPLIATPQRMSIALAGVNYQVTVRYCVPMVAWYLDLAAEDGTAILTGLPLITGADLLAQYAYLDIGGKLIVQSDNMPDAVPGFADLGKTGHLYFVT